MDDNPADGERGAHETDTGAPGEAAGAGESPASEDRAATDQPSQADLDAEDLAELARTSEDRDRSGLYPTRAQDPGPAPRALTQDALYVWWASTVLGVVVMVYGWVNLGEIIDLLRERLVDGVATDPNNAAPLDRVDSISGTFPPIMLVMIVVFSLIEYPLLRGIVTHHSRNLRNLFLTVALIHLLCIPIGIDLLFEYEGHDGLIPLLCWVQFALLAVAALMTVRRSVNQWLPTSTRMRPTRMLRAR